MKKQYLLAIALAALVGVVGFQSPAAAVVVGPDVVDRIGVDSAYQTTLLNPTIPSPISGHLTTWYLWAKAPGDVKLQVFRPVANGYLLVGENPVSVTDLGYNAIAIGTASQIEVLPGDVFGFRYGYSEPSPRPITFSWDGGGQVWTAVPPVGDTDVAVGEVLTFSMLAGWYDGRSYSLAAEIVPAAAVVPEPSALAALAVGMVGILGRRRR